MNCQNCMHYHDQGSNILCDAGIMEVILIGGPKVSVEMPECKMYVAIVTEETKPNEEYTVPSYALARAQPRGRGRPAKA